MNPRDTYMLKAMLAYFLRESGFDFAEIAAVFKVSKDKSRMLAARGQRLELLALIKEKNAKKTFTENP